MESNRTKKEEIIAEIYAFFDILAESERIIREETDNESVDIKNVYFNELCNLVEKFYTLEEIFKMDLNAVTLKYLDNLSENKIIVFRYNISDIITYSEIKIHDINLYIDNAQFKRLFDDIITSFRSLMIDIDKRKREKITEELKQLKQLEQLAGDIKKSHDSLNDRSNQLYKIIENIEKTASNILPQAITVLGIFVAILVVYLGAEELIGTLNRLFNDTPNYFFISLITISHVLFNFIFFLMFLLARISKSSINIRCTKFVDIKSVNEKDTNDDKIDVINESLKELLVDRRICANCIYANTENSLREGYFGDIFKSDEEYDKILSQQCGQFDKFIRKYAYIFFINVIFVLVELAFLSWWLFRDIIFKNYIFEIADPIICSLSVIALVVLAGFIVCKIMYGIGKIHTEDEKKKRKYFYIFSAIASLALILLLLFGGLDYHEVTNSVEEVEKNFFLFWLK